MKKIIEQMDSLDELVLRTVAELDDDRFSRRPSEAEWSVAEILHHLSVVEELIVKRIEKGLERPPQRLGLLRNIFKPPIWVASLRLIKVKAPKEAQPLNPPPRAVVIENFKSVRAKLKDIMLKHGRERLENITSRHPILGNYSGVDTASFAYYHELRHWKQIKEILPKLPKA